MVQPDISLSFCRPVIISATLVMFDFCICSLCVIYKHQTGIKNNRWVLSFIYLFICMWIVNILPFIYLFDYLFVYVCYLFIWFMCLFSLLFSFRWFPFPFVFTANNNRCYFIFIFHGQCKTGGGDSKWIDRLVVKHVLGGGLGLGNK